MALGPHTEGIYDPRHSHESLAGAVEAVQGGPIGSGGQIAVGDTSSQNGQWGLLPPTAQRQSASPSRSPSDAQPPLPPQPTPPAMFAPVFYDPTQVTTPQDGPDYQQWVDSYYANQQAQYYHPESSSSGMPQMPFEHPMASAAHHPSTQAHIAVPNAMPSQWTSEYPIAQPQYATPISQHPTTTYAPGYSNGRPSNRVPQHASVSRPVHRVGNGHGHYTPQVHDIPAQLPPNVIASSDYAPHSLSAQHMAQGQAGRDMQYYQSSDMEPPQPTNVPPQADSFRFQYHPTAPEANYPSAADSTNIPPTDDPRRTSQTPPTHPVLDDGRASDRGNISPSARTNGVPLQPRPSPVRNTAKGKANKRQRAVESDSSGDEYDSFQAPRGAVPPLKGPDSNPQRLPGACTHCKRLKMRCEFPKGDNTCRRCKTSGHQCIVEGRKPRNAPNKREYLLAQIRQKDNIIESLLKQLHNPYMATPLSIESYRMATPTGDENKSNVIAWLNRLQASVSSVGGSGGASAFNLDSRSPRSTEEDSDSDNEEQNEEPTERGSVNETVKAEEEEKLPFLPDVEVPLGLIADLALSQNRRRRKKTPKEEDDTDDDNVGVANESFFKPGPAHNLDIRAKVIEKHSPPDILVHNLVTPEDVDKLFEIFYARLNPHVSVLDPVLHTPSTTFARCPFLFTVVCAVASRYYSEKSEIYPIAMHFAKHAAANSLITGWKSVELAQAYIILSIYGVPAKKWEEDRGWLYTGLAIRIATDLNLHKLSPTKQGTEQQEREVINKIRVWMNCYNLDRSTATQFGKPSTIKEDFIVRKSDQWYKMSRFNHPYDIGLCAYTSQLRIMARFHDEIFSDPDAPSGLNERLDFHEVTRRYEEQLQQYFNEWEVRFREESDMDDPACKFRASLLPFFTSYSRLVMFSFGFQQAFRRSTVLQSNDQYFVDKCYEAAKAVITRMVDELAPSGFMRYAPDSHFIFGTFAAAFLLKLLKPEFTTSNIITKAQEEEIFQLIGRLIQTLNSPEIAIDERHTPKLHARFLAGLLSRYRRDVATTGRLHAQPPAPGQFQSGSSGADEFRPDVSAGPSQQVFSLAPGPVAGDHGSMGQSHTASDGQPPMQTEPVYQPEATYATDTGPMEVLDFDGAANEEEMLGALLALKNPAYWQDMMMPGFQWSEPRPNNQGIPGIHHSFNTFQPTGVV